MKNLFNSIQLKKPKSNVFDLSHDVKLSGDMGNLIPVCVLDAVPGDKFHISAETLIRFAPLLAPIMHRVDVSIHYFFVPNRILWPNWEKFIVDNGTTGIVPPYLNLKDQFGTTGDYAKFMDYMGVPPNPTANGVNINALPFAAYQAIYNEYYRDQNLQAEIPYKLNDGNVEATTGWFDIWFKLRRRAWEHDYFTASLPFAQKGPAVDIPLGTVGENAPVHANIAAPTVLSGTPTPVSVDANTSFNPPATQLWAETEGLDIEPTTINDLRRAFRLQEWLERNARGGTRYIENILAHFGVKSSDARLQRPEYITGVKSPVVISEVLNTTGIDGELPQGNMAGHGIALTSGKTGSYFCEEHGWIIGIMSVMPKTAYQQGIAKKFLKNDNLDYFWPSFAHLGEQPVTLNEVYAYTASSGNDTFGYVPRYAEYKYESSRVAGDFRTTLDYWHLGRKFASQPALNADFIECKPAETKRIFAVEEGADSLYCHVYNKIMAVRRMPKFGTPMM